jgi:hypothetical protein
METFAKYSGALSSLFYKSGCLENSVVHGVDSTELPAEINYPLSVVKIGKQ